MDDCQPLWQDQSPVASAERTEHTPRPAAASKLTLLRIRLSARALNKLGKTPSMAPLVRLLRTHPIGKRVGHWLAGYRRPFPDLETAAREAQRFLGSTHHDKANAREHLRLSVEQRVSDYPVIFHLSKLEAPRHLFDLGGNFGNLFYCYARYLPNTERMLWTVCDLPHVVEFGARVARHRHVDDRLRFTTDRTTANGADIFLVSGALHYFAEPLDRIIAGLADRPRHVFVNRAPLADAPAICTVQDAGFGLAACILHDRPSLIDGMKALGYSLIDEWAIHDMSLQIPLYPERSAACYRGLYFRLDDASA